LVKSGAILGYSGLLWLPGPQKIMILVYFWGNLGLFWVTVDSYGFPSPQDKHIFGYFRNYLMLLWVTVGSYGFPGPKK
jgi:hypothetical protein